VPGTGGERRPGRSPWLPRILLGVGLLAVVTAIVSLAVGEGGPQPQRIGETSAVQQLLGGIHQQGAELGDADAPVVITLFTDLRCTTCAEYQVQTIDPLIEELARTGDARFELRHYSLGSEPTTLAAEAAVAAGEQDRQWQYADLLVRNIDVAGNEVDDEFLVDVADSLAEFDTDAWQEARDSQEVADVLAADEKEGADLGLQVEGPSVLVTGPGGTRDLGVEPVAAAVTGAVDEVSG
jgi:protein-disulfide isomerase